MLCKERVKKTLDHERTDIVPYNIELTGGELTRVTDYLGIGKTSFDDYAGNHVEKASYNIGGYIRPGFFRDEFGVIWNQFGPELTAEGRSGQDGGPDEDIGVIDEFPLTEASLANFRFPKPDLDQVKKITEKLVGNGRNTFKFGEIGTSYFERAWSLRGMENLLTEFHLEPAFVQELLENILIFNLQIIDVAVDYDIDGFYLGDDYGHQNGLMMGPETWRKFIRPGLAKMFERVKAAGKVAALHSCGDISAILGDLIDIGLDIYQSVQPEVYDLKKLKAEYGEHITFWGAISTQQMLPFVRPAELKEIVRKTIDIMSDNGGYIAGPTHRIPEDVPVENVISLVEVLKEQ